MILGCLASAGWDGLTVGVFFGAVLRDLAELALVLSVLVFDLVAVAFLGAAVDAFFVAGF